MVRSLRTRPVLLITCLAIAGGVLASSAVAARTINGALLTKRSVPGTKLKVGAVGTIELRGLSVTSPKLRASSVTSTKIASGAVTSAKLAAGAVGAAAIADGSLSSGELADGAIITAKLADGAVTSSKVADGTIAVSDLAAGILPAAASGFTTGFPTLTLVPAPFSTTNAITLPAGKHVLQLSYRGAMTGQPWTCDYEKRINAGAWVIAAAGDEHTSVQDAHDEQLTESVAPGGATYEFRASCARTTATPVTIGSLDLSVVAVAVR